MKKINKVCFFSFLTLFCLVDYWIKEQKIHLGVQRKINIFFTLTE